MTTLNERFMEAAMDDASAGMSSIYRTRILPGMVLYRFADQSKPYGFFAGKWWIGFSPFEALRQQAQRRKQPLSAAARQCLAIDFAYNKTLDVLHKVILKEPLSAWAGTPRTQRIPEPGYAGLDRRWEPDREVTQLCIPGLGEPDPNNPPNKIWQRAFEQTLRLHIP
jgi:hypothetical protein